MRLTIAYDNRADRDDLRADWGFACVVEMGEETLLFDTGTHPEILVQNLETLGFDLTDFDGVMISHEHYDHVGGLDPIVRANAGIEVIVPASFSPEFRRRVRAGGGQIAEITGKQELWEGVATTGPVGESIIEQAMVLCTAEGIIAVTGCAHPGVVAMVQAAKEVFDTPVECVLGGFHLTDTPPAGVQAIIRQLRDLGVTTVGPCHCTGDAAIAHFSDEYGEDSLPVRAGWHRSFEPCS